MLIDDREDDLPSMLERVSDLLERGRRHLIVWRLERPGDEGSFRMIYSSHRRNPATGVSMEPLIGRTIREALPALLDTPAPRAYLEALEAGEPRTLPDLVCGDDRFPERGYHVSAHPLSAHHVGVVVEDVSRSARAGASHERRVHESADMQFSVALPSGVLSLFNRTMVERLGREPPCRLEELCDPGARESAREALERFATEGELQNHELALRAADGSRMHALLSIVGVRDGEGRVVAGRGTLRDISGRKRTPEESERLQGELEAHVEARTRELAAANRELESFAYSVSHDLRQPLRSMSGFCEALAEDYGEQLDDTARDYIRRILAASQRMGQLIDGLLALSRLSSRPLAREPVELASLVETSAAELREVFPEHPVEIEVERPLQVHGDPRMLRVVVDNLLGNAWKFTRGRERSRVTVRRAGDAIEIRDNGVGFDPRYADRLFGAFQRLHREDEFEGLGLGLATVQRIVHRHGGRVWAESTPGEGAAFWFTLPPG